MSGLRRSSGLTNVVADTLRLRDLSGGILTLSDRGVVRNDASPDFQSLFVRGYTQLQNTTVMGTLTANSVSALASMQSPVAEIGSLFASSATINSIQVTNADISSATIDLLNVSNAKVHHADISSAVIDYLPQFNSSGNIYSIVPSYATLPQLIVCDDPSGQK